MRLTTPMITLAGAAFGAWAVRKLLAARVTLAGEVVVVTGGSRGLGLLIARELAREGCRIVICARDKVELDRAREDLAAQGAEVVTVACDVAEPAQVDRLVSETMTRFGRIDILVNNAGIIQVAPLESLALADFQRTVAVNFWGTVHATLAVLPHMRAQRSGRIVNITSIGGKVAVPHLLPYDCAKFAAVGFSEGLRTEVAKDGVRVTTVVPGLMRTGSYKFALFKGRGEYRWFSLAARAPGISMPARRAARLIVQAVKRADAEVVIGLAAKALRLLSGLFPSVTSRTLQAANRLLPAPQARIVVGDVAGGG